MIIFHLHMDITQQLGCFMDHYGALGKIFYALNWLDLGLIMLITPQALLDPIVVFLHKLTALRWLVMLSWV